MTGPKELPRIPDQGNPILPIEPPPPPPPERHPRTDPAPPLSPEEEPEPVTTPDHEQRRSNLGMRLTRRAPFGSDPDEVLEDVEIIDRDEAIPPVRRPTPPGGYKPSGSRFMSNATVEITGRR